MSLSGKVIAVTGGAGGIGLATAKLISERGGIVCFSDISPGSLAEAEAYFKDLGRSYLAHKVNVAIRKEVEDWLDAIVAKFGRLDGAANVAGVIGKDHGVKAIAELDDDQWDQIMAVNLKGTMMCIRKQLQLIADGGSIVNVSSIHGLTGKFDPSSLFIVAYNAKQVCPNDQAYQTMEPTLQASTVLLDLRKPPQKRMATEKSE